MAAENELNSGVELKLEVFLDEVDDTDDVEDPLALIQDITTGIDTIDAYCMTNFTAIDKEKLGTENILKHVNENLKNLLGQSEKILRLNFSDKIELFVPLQGVMDIVGNRCENLLVTENNFDYLTEIMHEMHRINTKLVTIQKILDVCTVRPVVDKKPLSENIFYYPTDNVHISRTMTVGGFEVVKPVQGNWDFSDNTQDIVMKDIWVDLLEMHQCLQEVFECNMTGEKRPLSLSKEKNEKFLGWINIWEVVAQNFSGWGDAWFSVCDEISLLIITHGGVVACQEMWMKIIIVIENENARMEKKEEKEEKSTKDLFLLKPSEKRKNLEILSEINLFEHPAIKLPAEYNVGKSVNNGGCFFDSLASILNASPLCAEGEFLTEKSLRLLCYEFSLREPETLAQWRAQERGIKNQENVSNLALSPYHSIQYTFSEAQNHSFLWGSPELEGRIICRELEIPGIYKIEVIKLPDCEESIIGRYYITAEGTRPLTENENIDYSCPVLIVDQRELHTVPILPFQENLQHKNRPNQNQDQEVQVLLPSENSVTPGQENVTQASAQITTANPLKRPTSPSAIPSTLQNPHTNFFQPPAKKLKSEQTEQSQENTEIISANLDDKKALENLDLNLSP